MLFMVTIAKWLTIYEERKRRIWQLVLFYSHCFNTYSNKNTYEMTFMHVFNNSLLCYYDKSNYNEREFEVSIVNSLRCSRH